MPCSPWCPKEFDTSQQLKKNSNIYTYIEKKTERQRETERDTKTDSDRIMVAYALLLLLLSHFSPWDSPGKNTRLKQLGFLYFI